MTNITIFGKVSQDATAVLLKDGLNEVPMISFQVLDSGKPFSKCEPVFLEVHFMKEAAMSIKNYLVVNKPVNVIGTLKYKKYRTNGILKGKYYVDADYIELVNSMNNDKEVV